MRFLDYYRWFKRQQQRSRRAKRRRSKLTPEQKLEVRRMYFRAYYMENKEAALERVRRYRANMTDAERARVRKLDTDRRRRARAKERLNG